MSELPADNAVRQERARSDFVKGTVRPDAPGMVYYPSIGELAATYDLVEGVIAKTAREDDWLGARSKAQNTSLTLPYSVAVDADPGIVRRSERVVAEMESFDDSIFKLAKRGSVIADKAMAALEDEDDPIKAIRALKSVAQTMETFHRMAKTAYDPASIRPDNTVNILALNSLPASDDVVAKVAAIYAGLAQQAIDAGVDPNTIEGEVVNDES